MHLIALGWIYVVLMMALAEALGPGGSVLGAAFTFLLYGVLPLAIVLYVGGARLRARARRNESAGERAAAPERAGRARGVRQASGLAHVHERPSGAGSEASRVVMAGERSAAPERAGVSPPGAGSEASRVVISGVDPGDGGEPAGEAVAPVREEP